MGYLLATTEILWLLESMEDIHMKLNGIIIPPVTYHHHPLSTGKKWENPPADQWYRFWRMKHRNQKKYWKKLYEHRQELFLWTGRLHKGPGAVWLPIFLLVLRGWQINIDIVIIDWSSRGPKEVSVSLDQCSLS